MKFIAQPRNSQDKLDVLRSAGMTPAVVYGSGIDTTLISVQHSDFLKLYKTAGETTVIDLAITGGKTVPVLVHEIAYDPRTHKLQHVDFLAIDIKSAVTIPVPVEYVGESPAVRASLGVLNTLVDELEIEVLPSEIIHKLEVDISGLANLGDSIYIKDILKLLPPSAQPVQDSEVTMCVIGALQTDSRDDVPADIDFESIEAEKKGKKEDE